MMPQEALERWAALAGDPDEEWNLDEAALLFAVPEYPSLDVAAYLGRLDELAARCESARAHAHSSHEAARRICHQLFEIEGFLGDREHYDDPKNSFLNETLDRMLGIPITLSVIAISVGRRIGVEFEGIGMPGHFIVRHPVGPVYFDPFSGGYPVTEEDCRTRVASIFGDSLTWSQTFLEPVSKRQLLMRMLNNLKATYLRRGDLRRLRTILEYSYRLLPTPQEADLLRQLKEGGIEGIGE
jgi:regulator of sirC expression with transglutaminase-like and TPR domain